MSTDNTADAMLRLRDAVNDLARLTGTRIDIDIWTHDADTELAAELVASIPGAVATEWHACFGEEQREEQREVAWATTDGNAKIGAYERRHRGVA